MKTLVINLTRFGDLLQTQPVISGLKTRGDEVGLVCLENFAQASTLLEGVDQVFPLPGAAILSHLDQDWRKSLASFWTWGEGELRGFSPDRVLNLTSTLPARLLLKYAGSPNPQGFCLDAFGFSSHPSAWAAFLQASTRNRGCSPFNLVDQLCEVAGLPREGRKYQLAKPDAASVAEASELLQGQVPSDAKGLVGFQLGASADFRRWPVGHFVELGTMLWESQRLCPVLLGSPGEVELGQRYEQQSSTPVINVVGKTSLTGLAALLGHMKLLVTNDTGTMHLAAGLGIPVCAVFLATAQGWDTGPYAENSLCVEPEMDCHPCGFQHQCTIDHACRRHVHPSALYPYIESFLDAGRWDARDSGQGARAWVTLRDRYGLMKLRSISGHESDDRTAWIRLQRHLYRQFLDKSEFEPVQGAPSLSQEFLATVLPSLEQSSQLLFLLSQQAEVLCKTPIAQIKTRFLGNYERLTSVWSDNPNFSVLGDMWREQAQEAARDFAQLPGLISYYAGLTAAWKQCL